MYLHAANRILRYFQGTKDFGLLYKYANTKNLCAYTNNDYAGDTDNRKKNIWIRVYAEWGCNGLVIKETKCSQPIKHIS